MFGFKYGRKTAKKAWQEGLILGTIFNIILLIINLLFFQSLTILSIIYYFILLTFALIFTIIAKNKKESTQDET